MNRLNRVANVLTDKGVDAVEAVGSVITIVSDLAEGGTYWSAGWKAGMKAKVEESAHIATLERSLIMQKRVRAYELDLAAFEASISTK